MYTMSRILGQELRKRLSWSGYIQKKITKGEGVKWQKLFHPGRNITEIWTERNVEMPKCRSQESKIAS